MNLLSFTYYRDKAYDFIESDVLLCWKKDLSDIWQTAVLKNILHDDFTAYMKLFDMLFWLCISLNFNWVISKSLYFMLFPRFLFKNFFLLIKSQLLCHLEWGASKSVVY